MHVQPLRIGLIETQRVFAATLRRAVERDGDMIVVQTAMQVDELSSACDVVVFDADGHRAPASALLRRIRVQYGTVPVCMLSTRPALDVAPDDDTGPLTLLSKSVPAESLRRSLRSAHAARRRRSTSGR